MYTTHFETWLA